MATPQALLNEDERLPLLIGFQRVAENTAKTTRFIERGKGVYVYDTDGREYIEATASFYVAALGYMHDELIDAIHAQYRDLPFFTSALHRTSKSSLELSERLREVVPVPDAHILFGTTGSEANDFLVKLLYFQAVVRGQPQRRSIIARQGSYHGGTLATASLTGAHHEEFGLPLPGFLHVSQPDYHGDREPGETPDDYAARLARELEDLIDAQPAGSIAAFFTEPVSFSAGLKVPPATYFSNMVAVLKQHDIAFVADEVVTGFGRTGALFGSDTFGLRFQPVDATHWLNRSAGVSKSSVFLGRSLSCRATAFSLFWWTFDRSIPFGKYCLRRPLVFSFEPRCHGCCGSQKYTLMSVANVNRR